MEDDFVVDLLSSDLVSADLVPSDLAPLGLAADLKVSDFMTSGSARNASRGVFSRTLRLSSSSSRS